MHPDSASATRRSSLSTPVIGLIAFFTLVDLFATQAILPLLVHAYGVSPAAMGVAVNASTLGMAIGAGMRWALIARITVTAGQFLSRSRWITCPAA